MWRSLISTPWTQTTVNGRVENAPLLDEVLAAHTGWSWEDVTGQPVTNIQPSPNAFTVELLSDAAALDAILADSRFAVLLYEEVADAV